MAKRRAPTRRATKPTELDAVWREIAAIRRRLDALATVEHKVATLEQRSDIHAGKLAHVDTVAARVIGKLEAHTANLSGRDGVDGLLRRIRRACAHFEADE